MSEPQPRGVAQPEVERPAGARYVGGESLPSRMYINDKNEVVPDDMASKNADRVKVPEGYFVNEEWQLVRMVAVSGRQNV